jgi:hypothetical protein
MWILAFDLLGDGSWSRSDPKTCSENSMACYKKIEDFISSGRTKGENSKRLPSAAGEDGCMAIYVLDTLQDERITELDSDRYPHFNLLTFPGYH